MVQTSRKTRVSCPLRDDGPLKVVMTSRPSRLGKILGVSNGPSRSLSLDATGLGRRSAPVHLDHADISYVVMGTRPQKGKHHLTHSQWPVTVLTQFPFFFLRHSRQQTERCLLEDGWVPASRRGVGLSGVAVSSDSVEVPRARRSRANLGGRCDSSCALCRVRVPELASG